MCLPINSLTPVFLCVEPFVKPSLVVSLSLVGLLSACCPVCPEVKPDPRPDASTLSTTIRTVLYAEQLRELGYEPRIEDGNVIFKTENFTMLLSVDDDSQYMRMALPNFWALESEDEVTTALLLSHQITKETKAVKLFINDGDMWATVELFVADPRDVKPVLERSISIIQATVREFANRM